jgi:hypothetical protein
MEIAAAEAKYYLYKNPDAFEYLYWEALWWSIAQPN